MRAPCVCICPCMPRQPYFLLMDKYVALADCLKRKRDKAKRKMMALNEDKELCTVKGVE